MSEPVDVVAEMRERARYIDWRDDDRSQVSRSMLTRWATEMERLCAEVERLQTELYNFGSLTEQQLRSLDPISAEDDTEGYIDEALLFMEKHPETELCLVLCALVDDVRKFRNRLEGVQT